MRYHDTTLGDNDAEGLLAWLGRELPTATALTLRTGFFSAPGMALLAAPLQRLLAGGGRLVAVIGGDSLQCDVDALQALLDLCRLFPGAAQAYLIAEPAFQNAKTYHVQHQDGHESAWVGSANVTMGGFATNLEAAVTLDSRHDDVETVKRVHAATRAALAIPPLTPLDQAVINQLRGRWRQPWWQPGQRHLGPDTPLFQQRCEAVSERLERLAAGEDDLRIVPTGLHDLDTALVGGLRPGTLTVLASRTGAGASTLALNLLVHTAFARGHPACLYTFDTPLDVITLQVLSNRTLIPITLLHQSKLTDRQWLAVGEALDRAAVAPLFVDSGAPPNLDALSAAITAATHHRHFQLLVVDPPSAILMERGARPGFNDLAPTMRRLKALAMDLDTCIVTTAQLGRLADDPDWTPALPDLHDHDQLAPIADTIILMHRPDRVDLRHERRGETDLIIAKHRHGQPGTVTVGHHLPCARFHDSPPEDSR